MDLETFWFVLIAVLWAGYFVLEGFDFGVGMLLPFVPRGRRGTRRPPQDDRAGLGRQRGLARGRGRGNLRRLPGLVRDDVLGLLRRAAARARLPHRPRGLVRVAVEEREPALAVRVELGEHHRQPRCRARLGCRAREPRQRRAHRLGGDYAGDFWDLFSAYTVAAGLAVVLLFAFHGATFLTLRTTGELAARAEHAREASRDSGRDRRRRLRRLDRCRRDGSQRQGPVPTRASRRTRGRGARACGRLPVYRQERTRIRDDRPRDDFARRDALRRRCTRA